MPFARYDVQKEPCYYSTCLREYKTWNILKMRAECSEVAGRVLFDFWGPELRWKLHSASFKVVATVPKLKYGAAAMLRRSQRINLQSFFLRERSLRSALDEWLFCSLSCTITSCLLCRYPKNNKEQIVELLKKAWSSKSQQHVWCIESWWNDIYAGHEDEIISSIELRRHATIQDGVL